MNSEATEFVQVLQVESGGMNAFEFGEQEKVFLVRYSSAQKITDANVPFLEAINCSLQEVKGQPLSRYIRSSDTKVAEILQNLITNKLKEPIEIQVKFIDQTQHWLRCFIEPVTDNCSDDSSAQIIAFEITQVKRLEKIIDLQRGLFFASGISEDQLCRHFLEAVTKIMPFEFGILLACEQKDVQSICFLAANSSAEPIHQEITQRLKIDDSILFPQTAASESIEPFTELLQKVPQPIHTRSLVVLPIRIQNELFGSILLGNPEHGEIKPEFLAQLQTLVEHFGSMIFHTREKKKILTHEKELLSLFNSISEMLLLINEEGKILEINPTLSNKLPADLFDKKRDTIFALHPSEEFSLLQEAIEKTKESGTTIFRIPLVTATNGRIDTELEMVLGLWREEQVIICLYRDIRNQLKVEHLENERRRLATVLASSASILNSSLKLEDVFTHILITIGNVVPNTNTNIMVLDGDIARVVASRGYEKTGTKELLNSRIIDVTKLKNMADMIATKQEVVISDTRSEADWVAFPETAWIHSYVGAPIIVNGRVFGFLNCDCDQAGFYNETHGMNLKLFADQAAVAIENARLHDEVKRHLHQFTQINELTRKVLVSRNITEVVQQVCDPIMALFDANSIFVSRWDPKSKVATCLGNKGTGILADIPNQTEPGSPTLTEYVLNQKRATVLIASEASEEVAKMILRTFSDPYILGFPMVAAGNPFGAIFLGFERKNQITEEDKSIGEYAANQLATAIQKSLMLESEQKMTHQFSHANELITSLSRVAASVNSSGGPKGVMETMGEGLEKMHIHSMVLLMGDSEKNIKLEYSSRMRELKAFNEKVEANYFLEPYPLTTISEYRQVIQEQKAVFINHTMPFILKISPGELVPFIGRVNDIFGISQNTKSWLLPLISENKPVGILNLYGEELMEIDQKAGETFSGQISAALENAKLLAKVQQLAITDELTGALNRRGLFTNADLQFKTARRFDNSLSILMLDLDDFKEVNDTYGHDVGDEVLVEVVKRVKANIREIDVLGRYGGEEFVVLLIESDLKAASSVAERIRLAVEEQAISTNEGPVHLTVSIGVEELTAQIQTLEQIFKRADRALYIAKNRGKNQIATLIG